VSASVASLPFSLQIHSRSFETPVVNNYVIIFQGSNLLCLVPAHASKDEVAKGMMRAKGIEEF
jgi:hypothetical protein